MTLIKIKNYFAVIIFALFSILLIVNYIFSSFENSNFRLNILGNWNIHLFGIVFIFLLLNIPFQKEQKWKMVVNILNFAMIIPILALGIIGNNNPIIKEFNCDNSQFSFTTGYSTLGEQMYLNEGLFLTNKANVYLKDEPSTSKYISFIKQPSDELIAKVKKCYPNVSVRVRDGNNL
jgi:hypothetical protein